MPIFGEIAGDLSAKNVVDEIEFLVSKLKIRFINFADDILTLNQRRMIEICKEILERKLDINWWSETSVDRVSLKTLEWMKNAGCIQLCYGIESGSPLILKTINKQITVDQIIKAFELTHKVGIRANASIMPGNPNENEKTVEETIRLLERINLDGFQPL